MTIPWPSASWDATGRLPRQRRRRGPGDVLLAWVSASTTACRARGSPATRSRFRRPSWSTSTSTPTKSAGTIPSTSASSATPDGPPPCSRRWRPRRVPTAATPGAARWPSGAGLGGVHRSPAERPRPSPHAPRARGPALREVMPEDGIILADFGVHHNWLVQHWPARPPQTVLNPGDSRRWASGWAGCWGPSSRPRPPCDRGMRRRRLHDAADALATAVEYGIPATWVVWNNSGYVSIRDMQRGRSARRRRRCSDREATGEPFSPDYATLARACGAEGLRVTGPVNWGRSARRSVPIGPGRDWPST